MIEMATTDIYRIKTRNSIYEIQVRVSSWKTESRCRKDGTKDWYQVDDLTGDYLEELCIGPAFVIPGVTTTSNVIDYAHYVLSTEPKRKARQTGSATGIPEFFEMFAQQVAQQARS